MLLLLKWIIFNIVTLDFFLLLFGLLSIGNIHLGWWCFIFFHKSYLYLPGQACDGFDLTEAKKWFFVLSHSRLANGALFFCTLFQFFKLYQSEVYPHSRHAYLGSMSQPISTLFSPDFNKTFHVKPLKAFWMVLAIEKRENFWCRRQK